MFKLNYFNVINSMPSRLYTPIHVCVCVELPSELKVHDLYTNTETIRLDLTKR